MSRQAPSAHTRRAGQRGLSLVEVLVGLAISLALVAGLALMFGNASRSATELDKSARHIENGRQAIDLLTDDIQLAGFYGTVPITATPATDLNPAGCGTMAALATALQGLQAGAPVTVPAGLRGLTPSEAAALAAAYPGCMPRYVSGTPALVLRRLDVDSVAASAAAAGTLYVQSSHYAGDTTTGYIASTTASSFTLHSIAAAASGPLASNLNPVRRFISRVYYLASCNLCNPDDGIPTLVRSEITASGYQVAPLAEGIERLAFDYGIDTNADGAPDEWYGLNGAAGATEASNMATKGWGNVVAVRLSLVSRNAESSQGWNNGDRRYPVGLQGSVAATAFNPATDAPGQMNFKRRAYTSTVRVNNVAGVREGP